MPNENGQIQQLEITLDYKGANLADHRMDLNDFIQSVSGMNDLLSLVATKFGLPEEAFKIDITSVENGCIKVKIVPILNGIVKASEIVGGLVALNDYVIKPGYNMLIDVWENVSNFIEAKKSADDENYFSRNLGNVSPIQAKLYSSPEAHCAVEQFSQCLEAEVEEIEMATMDYPDANVTILNTDRQSLKITPFHKDDVDESSENILMKLYLEGAHIDASSKWQFYVRSEKSGKKTKNINAEVLDNDLLKQGRQQGLEVFENKPLLCNVIIKTLKRDGKKRAVKEYFITKCSPDVSAELLIET